jgi:hypothetical protein
MLGWHDVLLEPVLLRVGVLRCRRALLRLLRRPYPTKPALFDAGLRDVPQELSRLQVTYRTLAEANILASMSAWGLPLACSTAVALLGCGGNLSVDSATGTTGGGGNAHATTSSGSPTATSSSGAGGSGPPPIALVATSTNPSLPKTCAAYPNLVPPSPVFVIVANQPITCQATVPAEYSHCIEPYYAEPLMWEVCFTLALADLQPGTTLTLGTTSLPFGTVQYAECGGCGVASCGGGGSVGQGSITIASVQPDAVSFTLAGGMSFKVAAPEKSVPLDGAFTAQRCP